MAGQKYLALIFNDKKNEIIKSSFLWKASKEEAETEFRDINSELLENGDLRVVVVKA